MGRRLRVQDFWLNGCILNLKRFFFFFLSKNDKRKSAEECGNKWLTDMSEKDLRTFLVSDVCVLKSQNISIEIFNIFSRS